MSSAQSAIQTCAVLSGFSVPKLRYAPLSSCTEARYATPRVTASFASGASRYGASDCSVIAVTSGSPKSPVSDQPPSCACRPASSVTVCSCVIFSDVTPLFIRCSAKIQLMMPCLPALDSRISVHAGDCCPVQAMYVSAMRSRDVAEGSSILSSTERIASP